MRCSQSVGQGEHLRACTASSKEVANLIARLACDKNGLSIKLGDLLV